MINGILESRKAQYLKDARGVLERSKYKGEKMVRFMYTRWEDSEYVADWRVVREYERESIVIG
jgi:heme-degrading monooxygenase HmoA